ncbi:Flagellum-specific peptidoglycan hydrolase FlgJ [Parapedobacter composti]|uniref:Peptidoglycan hydrolase n=1 Tax=Parapedobacter composti TaxID=623281 RepID=A0A1I1FZS0_9SPHI|nr:Flagellum-specific peptidoglycan hydrolase FlgJ [Parapedobacter composti]
MTPVGQVFAQYSSPQHYIETYKDMAVQYMETHGCPASLILAVAIHESAYGSSKVARYLNNHFGIKGPNNSKEIRSAYKGYASVEQSYEDFIALLKRRKSTQRLFDLCQPHEYKRWVQGIARSGYAHSTSWASKVIGTIEKYSLHELDKQPEVTAAAAAESESAPATQYTVKKGDTLYDLARKHGTTVKAIQRINGLTDARLRIGQQLIL